VIQSAPGNGGAIVTDRKRGALALPGTDAPLHERLAEAIALLVAAGDYRPGDRLPTHRAIAGEAGVAIGTVTRAIDLLGRRGLVRGEVGRGTFVSAAPDPADTIVDLTINAPPVVIDEAALLAAGQRGIAKAATLPSGGYADPRGTAGQRTTVAAWLARTRLAATADEILLCVGAQHAIHLAFSDLKALSGCIATEGATFTGAIAAAADLGLALEPVDHDVEGLDPADLDRVLRETGCRIVYTTPVCQNPLGFETGDARRREILAVCARHDALIVEDDTYGLYARKGRLTYKALAPDRVYYLTSLSKCLTSLVRLGVLVPPPGRRSAVARGLRAAVWGASPLAVEVGCAALEAGLERTAADRLRAEAKERAVMTARLLGLETLAMPEGAPHIWLPMSSLAAEKLARRASERGVRLTPPDATAIGGAKSGGVRLCVMAPPQRSSLERALRIVAELQATPEDAIV
jgi:DNA-binding transcriptional MocR family regulator